MKPRTRVQLSPTRACLLPEEMGMSRSLGHWYLNSQRAAFKTQPETETSRVRSPAGQHLPHDAALFVPPFLVLHSFPRPAGWPRAARPPASPPAQGQLRLTVVCGCPRPAAGKWNRNRPPLGPACGAFFVASRNPYTGWASGRPQKPPDLFHCFAERELMLLAQEQGLLLAYPGCR